MQREAVVKGKKPEAHQYDGLAYGDGMVAEQLRARKHGIGDAG